MAEGPDDSEKTEDPTQKRLDDARDKGQVAVSREINTWFALVAGGIAVMMILPGMARDMHRLLLPFIEQPHRIPLDPGHLLSVVTDLLLRSAGLLAIPMALMMVAAVAAGVLQNGVLFTPESLKPKLEKIALGAGLKRLFSTRSLVEFVKDVLKLIVVGSVVAWLIMPVFGQIESMIRVEPLVTLEAMQKMAVHLIVAVIAMITVIAGLDLGFQKLKHLQSMRMTRQEVKDELKESEGDPMVRARLRQIRQSRARKRMMAAVPSATVVVTNPTHYAVALRFEIEEMAAPQVVAKGADFMARTIRDLAGQHGVPVVENPPLARALYAVVEVDQEIPPEHYKAVAEIISYVYRLKERGRKR